MYIFDSAKKKKLKFEPMNKKVNLYLCGPTVYDDAHLGHAKSAVNFDILIRVLIANGYEVNFVRNYTDIDDKIIKKAKETSLSLQEIAEKYIKSYENDMNALNTIKPNLKPKATEYIKHIINYIQILLNKNYAYKKTDGIYFSSEKDKKYFSLSQRGNELKSRINQRDKEDDKDFVLWKFDEEYYDSPFGKGRPGWHSECVAMIRENFKSDDKFEVDIHAGGIDLLFPHHENEAAQCRCALDKELSKYWMHNGFINVNNIKMSKSLNNSFFIKDALKIVDGEVLRFYLLSVHYRANFNYSLDDLLACKKRLDKIYRLKQRLYNIKNLNLKNNLKNKILSALNDDLNTSKAISILDEFIKEANEKLDSNFGKKDEILSELNNACDLIGIGQRDVFAYFQFGINEQEKKEIENLLDKRSEAKKNKNYILADQIRNDLNKKGINIMDGPNGSKWEKIDALAI